MQNQISTKQVESFSIPNLGRHNCTAHVYLEPNNSYSEGGGRINIAIPEYDVIGTHFFSHVGPDTLIEFIAGCDAPYLMGKLFKIESSIPLEDSNDVFEWVREQGMEQLKEARHSGVVSKGELRKLHEFLNGRDFDSARHLVECLETDLFTTVSNIYGDDWYFELNLSKPNPHYQEVKRIMEGVLSALKEIIKAQAPKSAPVADQVLMPIEPTQEIFRAFYDAFSLSEGGNTAQRFKEGYKAIVQYIRGQENEKSAP